MTYWAADLGVVQALLRDLDGEGKQGCRSERDLMMQETNQVSLSTLIRQTCKLSIWVFVLLYTRDLAQETKWREETEEP